MSGFKSYLSYLSAPYITAAFLSSSPPPLFATTDRSIALSLSLSIPHGGRLSRQTDPVNLPWPFSSTLSLSLFYFFSVASLCSVSFRPIFSSPQVARQTVKENSVQRSGGIVMTAFNVPMHAAFVIVPHRLPNLSFQPSYRTGLDRLISEDAFASRVLPTDDAFARTRQFIEDISLHSANRIPLPCFPPSIYSLAISNNLHTYTYTHPVNLIQFNRIDRSKYSTVNSCKKCSNRSFPFKRFSKVREGKQFAEHGEWRGGEMCNGSTLPVGSFQDV